MNALDFPPALALTVALSLPLALLACSSSPPPRQPTSVLEAEPRPSTQAPPETEPLPEPPPPPPPPPPPAKPAGSETLGDVDEGAGGEQQVPRASLMDLAIYAPGPDLKALQDTKAARFDKADGDAVIAFCVGTDGKTYSIRVEQPFPGDPMVDKILIDTIAKWRFKPWLVDGEPTRVCSQRTFKLRFK